MADWKDPDKWLTFAAAADNMADNPDLHLGFVLGADEDGAWVGVDLDKCLGESGITPQASGLLSFLESEGAYIEVSPSGTGFKAFGRGAAPEWVEANYATQPATLAGDRAPRFFAVTGKAWKDGGDPTATINLEAIKAVLGETPAGSEAPQPHHLPDSVPAGGQNAMLFKEACVHVRAGKSEDEVFALIKAIQRNRAPSTPGAPPWTDSDIRAIVNSAMRYGPRDDNFNNTESGDAECFAHLHKDSVRFDHRQGRWLQFDGARWRPQKQGEVERLSLDTVRWRQESALKIDDPAIRTARQKWAAGGESMRRRSALLSAAKLEHPISSSGEEWDTDLWTLGVPNGVVDLRSGQLRAGRPEDHITKTAAFPFDPEAECTLWEATVADIFKDNPDLVSYFQRLMGYCLTGDTREEVFFILLGGGRNGKGTLMSTVENIMGDYSTSLSMRSLEGSRYGQTGSAASPDIAKLAGARLITSSETSGGRFDTALLKGLTGRDTMSARHLHQNEFEFIPVGKLVISLNERPRVTDQSLGFWERPHLIPFNQCYADNPDRTLKDRLLVDGSGILAWMVRGCLSWAEQGLGKPPAVVAAVEDYRASQRPLTEFLEERCVLTHDAETAGAALYEEYRIYADERRLYPGDRLTRRKFSMEMMGMPGILRKHTRNGAHFTGVGIRTTPGGGEY